MKLSLKSNLRLGLGLSLCLLIISAVASYFSINQLIRNANMVSHTNTLLMQLESTMSTLADAETGQRGYLLTGNKVFLEPYTGAREEINHLFEDLKNQTADNPVQQQKLAELRNLIDNRLNSIDNTIKVKAAGASVSESYLLDGKVYMDKMRRIIAEMQKEEQRLLHIRSASFQTFVDYTPMLILFAAALAVVITLFFYRKVALDFDHRMRLQQELEALNTDTARRIEMIQDVAEQISDGHYDLRLEADGKDGLGQLAGSLNEMASSLQHSFKLLEDKEWMQSGIAALNDKMVGEKDVESLAQEVLQMVVPFTKSHIGAFYILGSDQKLYLKAGYAIDKNAQKPVIDLGEGLTGQALASNQFLILDELPDNDLTVTYGSGYTKPRALLLAPILKDGMMVGVIELGALQAYPPRKLDFLRTVSNNIGIAIQTAQNRKKLQELLEETQAQTEELQSQHTELENLNAELEAHTQRIKASEEELRVQQEELLHSNQELEERSSLLEEKNQIIQERNVEIQQKAEQLEQSTRYKSEFLANMSHELRTPLNSILLLSKLMADNTDLDHEYTEYAEVIQSSGQSLLTLIDEILDLSKIEAGKMELEIEEVPIKAVKNDLQKLFTPIARDKKLEYKVLSGKQLPESMLTDKLRLEQILKNLLSNAFKFTHSGSVTLRMALDEETQRLLFTVSDTGIGIAADKLNMVFQAFQQADGSTRRRFGGTGLGLSISRELARLLGGRISVESVEGEGSTFSLDVPLRYNPDNPALETANMSLSTARHRTGESGEAKVMLSESPTRYTVSFIPEPIADDRDSIEPADKVILIIEDDTIFAKMLLEFTRKRQYKGLVAVRGDSGVELAVQYRPLAILLDIQLPVKDGWEVLEELKANPKTRPIPVHVMSSLSVRKESLMKGAVDFIDKPVATQQMQQIFEKLEDALSRFPKKVLIIEENKLHAEALSYFLSNAHIHTRVESRIDQSIEALQRQEVDCVILDMGVPDKAAYETLEILKQSEGLEKLPIIVFTGKNLSKSEESRIKQYADSIILKTAHSYQRLLDEAGLFLHLVEENEKKDLPKGQRFGSLHQVLKGKKVLIADDDVRNIFSLTKILEQHQMQVFSATDGKEALRILAGNPSMDIILMDMMMPEMDGYETIKMIREQPAYKQLPILAVTAKAMMGDREKCIAAGASDYISKPVDTDQLISLLRVWLYHRI